MEKFRFEIVKPLGIIREVNRNGETWTKEVNLVSWNDNEPKVDVREWDCNHVRMSKGMTLTNEETEQLCMILHNYMRERSRK